MYTYPLLLLFRHVVRTCMRLATMSLVFLLLFSSDVLLVPDEVEAEVVVVVVVALCSMLVTTG